MCIYVCTCVCVYVCVHTSSVRAQGGAAGGWRRRYVQLWARVLNVRKSRAFQHTRLSCQPECAPYRAPTPTRATPTTTTTTALPLQCTCVHGVSCHAMPCHVRLPRTPRACTRHGGQTQPLGRCPASALSRPHHHHRAHRHRTHRCHHHRCRHRHRHRHPCHACPRQRGGLRRCQCRRRRCARPTRQHASHAAPPPRVPLSLPRRMRRRRWWRRRRCHPLSLPLPLLPLPASVMAPHPVAQHPAAHPAAQWRCCSGCAPRTCGQGLLRSCWWVGGWQGGVGDRVVWYRVVVARLGGLGGDGGGGAGVGGARGVSEASTNERFGRTGSPSG